MAIHDFRFVGLAAVLVTVATQVLSFEPKPVEPVTLKDVRGMRFCEFVLIYDDRVEIYNTSASAGCPDEIWSTITPAAIATEHGAKAAQLNGPKFWAMDEQTVGFGETQTFGGIEARYAASLPTASVGSGTGANPYAPYVTQKSQNMIFRAGNPVYELVDSDGDVFVMNAYGDKVEGGDPANLATQLTLPDGWMFRVAISDQDLVIDQKIDTPSKMVGDNFEQYYSMIDQSDG